MKQPIPRAARVCCPLLLVALLLPLLLGGAGCKSRKVNVAATDEETPRMASALNMGDPKSEPQLITGFHGIEAGAWRWTGKQFTVALRPPFGASQKGARLNLRIVGRYIEPDNDGRTAIFDRRSVPPAALERFGPAQYELQLAHRAGGLAQ